MKDLVRTLSHKKIFILPIGKWQQDFEYIFSDFNIYGYIDIDESGVDTYSGKPVRKLEEALRTEEAFVLLCEEKNPERRAYLEKNKCRYGEGFCFSEDLFGTLDYDLMDAAGGREIVLCGEGAYRYRKPDLLLDGNRYGGTLCGMEILNPVSFDGWDGCFVVVTVEKPEEIFSVLEAKGLSRNKDFAWYRELDDAVLRKDQKVAFYGCGHTAEGILEKAERGITRSVSIEGLTACDPRRQYVVMTGDISDKYAVLASRGYQEIKDFVHWDYVRKMEDLKPSVLLKQTMLAPVVDQPKCESPFEFAYITSEGEVYGCICPGWTCWGFGNIKQESCQSVWHSIYARIFRLSVLNRTFCFCREEYCYQCSPLRRNALDTERRFECRTRMYPKIVKPCIDDSCNLYCESCRSVPRAAEGRDLQEKEFMAGRLSESGWLESAEMLTVAGMGEVFFSRIYRKLLYEVREKRNTIHILSNGLLFTQEEFERLLQRYRFIDVEISVDAASRKTYEKLRRGGSWEKLMRNLSALGEERARGRMRSFTVNMVVQRENYREISEFIRLGKRVHADTVAIRPLMNWGTYAEEQYQEISMISHKNNWVSEELREVLKSPLLNEKEADWTWFQKRL